MREILFRGKRLQGGEWVEGYFFKSDINKKERESGKATIIFTPDCDTFIMVPECHNSFMVVSDTVGQYTGMKDKNGKRVFEGDVVKTSDVTHEGFIQIPGESFEIAMRKGCWLMVSGEDWDFLETNHECIKVIGNIHDNPEMLKGGEG